MTQFKSRKTGRTLHRRSFIRKAAGMVGAAALTRRSSAADADKPFIDAYAGRLSYLPSEEVALHVSTGAARFHLEVARLGAKREVVFRKEDVAGAKHSVPTNASSEGCGWPVALKVPIAR